MKIEFSREELTTLRSILRIELLDATTEQYRKEVLSMLSKINSGIECPFE